MSYKSYLSKFKVGGVQVDEYPANADFTTDSIDIEFDWVFSIQTVLSVVVGNPTLTIQCSNDNVNWVNYTTSATDVDLTNTSNHMIIDSNFPCQYMRLQYVSGGNSGNITLIYKLKN